MTTNRLEGKVAIVTGAAQGLGKAIAVELASEGASVIITDIQSELVSFAVEDLKSKGYIAVGSTTDISDADQVEAMVAFAIEKFGTVDILVNNAGLMRTTKPVESINLSEWQTMINVNVTGVFLCMKAVLPILKAKKQGKIVNVSSSAGRSMSTFNGAHYTTTKAAVLGLTRHSANEAAPYNININAIAPGSFDTEGGRELLGDAPQSFLDAAEQKIPLKRFGKPEDVGKLVLFLSTDDSSYITGATIDINGGELMM